MKKDEFEVLTIFSSINLEKVFHVKQSLDSYSSIISNQRISDIKKYFIEIVEILEENDIIENNYKIISNRKFYKIDQLTTHNISESFVLYEKLLP